MNVRAIGVTAAVLAAPVLAVGALGAAAHATVSPKAPVVRKDPQPDAGKQLAADLTKAQKALAKLDRDAKAAGARNVLEGIDVKSVLAAMQKASDKLKAKNDAMAKAAKNDAMAKAAAKNDALAKAAAKNDALAKAAAENAPQG